MTYALPEPDHSSLAFVAFRTGKSPIVNYYTAAQMLEAYQAGQRDMREMAAKLVAEHFDENGPWLHADDVLALPIGEPTP